MTKNEILRNAVDEKIEMLNYFRASMVSAYNNSDTHTDEEVLKFSKYKNYLDEEIVFNNARKLFLELIDLID